MANGEKQKVIDALKISAPVMAMTQEEFNDYIQTLNKIMNWLEQESVIDKIRAEIKQEYTKFRNKSDMWNERACGLGTALEIIDKYKAETEDA